MWIAMISRVSNNIYELAAYWNDDFNHYVREQYHEIWRDFLYHLPILFYLLASWWFLMRWLDFYYSTPECVNFDSIIGRKRAKLIKWLFTIISLLIWIAYFLTLGLRLGRCDVELYLSILFFIVSIGILISFHMYIRKVKRINKFKEITLKLKIIAWVASALLFIKAIDSMMIFIAELVTSRGSNKNRDFDDVFDYLQIIFQFLELAPSCALAYGQCLSYLEIKMLLRESMISILIIIVRSEIFRDQLSSTLGNFNIANMMNQDNSDNQVGSGKYAKNEEKQSNSEFLFVAKSNNVSWNHQSWDIDMSTSNRRKNEKKFIQK